MNDVWKLVLNDEEIARLDRVDERGEHRYRVPAGAVRSGKNTLSFVPVTPTDDVTLGPIRLVRQSLEEHYDLQTVRVRVFDADTGKRLPARVTVLDANGERAEVFCEPSPKRAFRRGVAYTFEGDAEIVLAAGRYRLVATRGPEWGLAEAEVELAGRGAEVKLSIRREVDTTGWIAADTHIHTLTYSGHGDSSVEERMLTLAGEGVELAISTDHNHNTDYRPVQSDLGHERWFTPVVGNEVTTDVGHFNGFPLDPDDDVPPYELTDYVQIVEGIRAKGAQVVILNHPRWPSHEDSPFGDHALSHLTGERTPPLPLPVDAMELVNSTTDEPEPMLLFRDWFALLNRGEEVWAVGSSDSHTVGDPVGGGRTLIPSRTDDPARIDVTAACKAIREGRTTISMGPFVTVAVDGEAGPGDVHAVEAESVEVALRVQVPSWIRVERAQVFVDGLLAREADIAAPAEGEPLDTTLRLRVPIPVHHDSWLVCVVAGPEVGPWYPLHNPYVLAATNPVRLDRDRDGWHAPRMEAQRLIGEATDDAALRELFAAVDESVALHAADLLARGGEDARVRLREASGPRAETSPRLRRLLELLSEPHREDLP